MLVSVSVCDALLPVVRLPKFMEAGLAERCSACVRPVPLNPMASGELGALLTRVSVPGKLLAAVGANATLNAPEAPGASEKGNARPDKL